MRSLNVVRGFCAVALLVATVDAACALEFYSQDSYEFPHGGATSKLPQPIAADDFTPTADWLVTRVTFGGGWQTEGSPLPPTGGTTPIRLAFHTEAAGLPAEPPIYLSTIMADATPRPDQPAGLLYFDFDLALPAPVLLSSGVPYWLSVADGRPAPPEGSSMFWEFSPDGNGDLAQTHTNGSGQWVFFDFDDLVFSLHGVPEPSTFALVAGALALVTFSRRRSTR